MSIGSIAAFFAVWTAIIQAGFILGLANGAVWVKAAFVVILIAAIASQRPSSTKVWLEGLNR